jgi:hypothetical protein
MDPSVINGILGMLGNMTNQNNNESNGNTQKIPDIGALAGLAGLLGGSGGGIGGGITPDTYICRFDENGRRQETYPVDRTMTEEKKQELLDKGYVEISKEEWQIYVSESGKNGTGMIRGEDGKPTDAPPHVPTKEERLNTLKIEYEGKKESLVKEFMTAMAYGDMDKQVEIQNNLRKLDSEYNANVAEIENE